jgi:2-methylisocitrate lyase-like PEP mutase family enzyme
MTSRFQKFKALHAATGLFILPNAWGAKSVVILQDCDYPVAGISNATIVPIRTISLNLIR